jgi:hypothetical protein
MGVCGAVLLIALVLAVKWSAVPFQSPPPIDAPSVGEVARRFAWHCALLLGAGITAGICVIGTGGRLAMRLLAVTGGDEAQGRLTEADEVVGEVTLGGTIGFVLFVGIFMGVLAAAVYLVIRRMLPAGWVGGLLFGAGSLVVVGPIGDPLRDENPDFDIVGPGWVAVLMFTALALAFGVALASFAARLSLWLPLPSTDRSVLLRYLPIAAVALVGFQLTGPLVLCGALVVAATRWPAVVRWVRSRTFVRVGRIALVTVVVIALPGAIPSMADIISRGPQ